MRRVGYEVVMPRVRNDDVDARTCSAYPVNLFQHADGIAQMLQDVLHQHFVHAAIVEGPRESLQIQLRSIANRVLIDVVPVWQKIAAAAAIQT